MRWIYVLGGLAALGALGTVFPIANSPDPVPASGTVEAEERAAADRLLGAMIRCENQTKAQLADPEGFDPMPYGQWESVETAEARHVFRFKARARNGFGALVWADFICTAIHDGTAWSAEVQQD